MWFRFKYIFSIIIILISYSMNNYGMAKFIKHLSMAVDEKQLDKNGKFYLTYLIEENDIFKKKICECVPKYKCFNREIINLIRYMIEIL